MSLYHEAASILLTAQKDGGSLKAIIFSKKTWKSDPKTLFALTTEAAKWSPILSEVVERSGILKLEKNLTPTLALLLTHDLFLAKKGIALPAAHGLNATISRHKVRLSAELTRARLREGFATLDALRQHLNVESANGCVGTSNGEKRNRHPRWIRINTIKVSLETELGTTFRDYAQVKSLQGITNALPNSRVLYIDLHIPNLVAIASPDDPTTYKSYREGKLILQEKASCFPAYLLDPRPDEGGVIDSCAAPGNKTTHLAAILVASSSSRIIACEKDPERSRTLEQMVRLAGADKIASVRQKQDFLQLDPNAKEMATVTSLLLDPSCSGSGIVGRDEGSITMRLPSVNTEDSTPKGRKRKRVIQPPPPPPRREQGPDSSDAEVIEQSADQDFDTQAKLKARLDNLSAFQLRLLQHAMHFPAAKRITYSTCSIHAEENETVVVRALLSDIAVQRGWRVLRREEQVDGMWRWERRGVKDAVQEAMMSASVADERKRNIDVAEVTDGCIRCEKGGDEGTMGFFVAGFVRKEQINGSVEAVAEAEEEEEEWNGFSSDEG